MYIDFTNQTYHDVGYPLSISRYLVGADPVKVISAEPTLHPHDKRVDVAGRAILAFPNDVVGEIYYHARKPGWGPLNLAPDAPTFNAEVQCEGGIVKLTNFVFPSLYNSVEIIPKKGNGRVENVYTFKDGSQGEEWWSTFV